MQTATGADLAAPARVNMADSAYASLHEMLLTHRLPLDAALSERNLAAELGISRTPVREALRRLEGEGLLTRQPGGLLFVRRIGVEEFLEVLHLRRLLEGEAAAAAAGKLPREAIGQFRARIAALLAASGRPDGERLGIDLDLHRAILGAAGNATLARMLEDLRRRMLLFATPPAPEDPRRACADYLAILDALADGDAEAARAAMGRHLDALRAGILRRLAAL
ncbi:GntR family transcriptional regulator [Roseomonas marmotae]|uniref:GntR family transcriptional regulator n=1 Tax=Roseomonas marmotae TaxID=2768161 RepID=A0ABS3K957_9PROT|nr:GntR family transcriptional regulator [Roseomonas marmotae]MBO1073460.1 GntR family transcriptional regulator [Roseomonas marmotae]QTI80345.1 GntR family transcriptional regulator [Roseomonas marmotae]